MAFRSFDRQGLFGFTTIVSCLFWPSITQGASISSSITFQQKAISPTCTTDAAGSSSCNVGINSVSVSYASLDGGYQWLTDEVKTTTESGGVKTTSTSYSFTAKETNFLSSMAITTTVSGKPTTTTSKEYFSFVTATPLADGKAESAVVAAVVIAPALVPSIQKVADGAAGKSVQQLVSDLTTVLSGQKITLTSGELTTLATYLVNLVAIGATAELAAVKIGPYLQGATAPLNPATNNAVTTTSSSSGPTVTAIMKTPYESWQAIFLAVGTGAPGPLPSDSSSSTTSKTSSTSTKASATPRPEYAQVCTPHADPNVPFSRADGIDAINRGCDLYQQIVLPDAAQPLEIIFNNEGGAMVKGTLSWSQSGQDGCKDMQTNKLSSTDCQNLFKSAMDNCDTTTTDKKYGAKPMTWSGPNGCIDVNMWAEKA